jgi:hypothetical protein
MNKRQPRRRGESRRFNLTLYEEDVQLLETFASQLGEPPTKVAGDYIRRLLEGARAADGTVEPAQAEAILRGFRGEDNRRPSQPRWEWPIEAILADGRWWDRWLPDLNELMGRKLTPPRISGDYEHRPKPVLDRRGYADVLEFLFPTIAGPRGAVTWRSPQYPHVAAITNGDESDAGLVYVWESVLRHVTRALCALEETGQPTATAVMGVLTQDHIAGPWLRTLRRLTGEDEPSDLPTKRLA